MLGKQRDLIQENRYVSTTSKRIFGANLKLLRIEEIPESLSLFKALRD
jgi:hypothetical protein